MKTVLKNDRLPNGRVAMLMDGKIFCEYFVNGNTTYQIGTKQHNRWPNQNWNDKYPWIKLSTRTYYESIC